MRSTETTAGPSIKAKTVEKDRAAAFDRGRFADTTDTAKRSYYYEGERRTAQLDTAPSGSSSSSRSSSRSTTAASPRTGAVAAGNDGSDGADMSDDEEVIHRARAATQALLGGTRPASAKAKAEGASTTASPNDRLAAYLRGRAASVPTMDSSPRAAPAATAASVGAAAGLPMVSNYAVPNSLPSAGLKATSAAGHQPRGATEAAPITSSAVVEALQMHTTNSDFQQLMSLLESDVRQEQQQQQQQSQQRPGEPVSSASSTGAGASSLEGRVRTPAQQPARTFAALESTALEQLFEDWCGDQPTNAAEDASTTAASHAGKGGSNEHIDDDGPVFIAADHRAAAFTLAAVAARDLDSSSWGRRVGTGGGATAAAASVGLFSAASVSNAPLTWEELVQDEAARRNARSSNPTASTAGGRTALLSNPAAVAEQATQQLRRFLQSVDCVERLVGNRRFMRSVAGFLYEHHKVFLPHYTRGTPSHAALPARADSAVVEHGHEEYAVYREFGQRVSSALLSLLSDNVEGFDEGEFVEALYDTPATFTAEDPTGLSTPKGPQNVLSFPAWRLVLAMSDFASFFAWMMDYIYEEYHLDTLEVEAGTRVAVGGTRGLRALIRSTYQRPADEDAAAEEAPIAPQLDATLPKPSPLPDRSSRQSPLASAELPVVGGDVSRTAPSSTLSVPSHQAESPLRPGHALTPLPSSASLQPAPPPARTPLSASLNSSPGGVHLRQFFPSPPASAEGNTRTVAAAKSAAAAPAYRKRQTTHPGRNLPPITPATDGMLRQSSADEPDTTGRSPLNLSVSVPASVRRIGSTADEGAVRSSATSTPLAPTMTTAKTASAAPAHRPARSRSSAEKAGGAAATTTAAAAEGGGTSRRGSKTATKPKSRTSSTTRPKVEEAPKAKPLRPKMHR